MASHWYWKNQEPSEENSLKKKWKNSVLKNSYLNAVPAFTTLWLERLFLRQKCLFKDIKWKAVTKGAKPTLGFAALQMVNKQKDAEFSSGLSFASILYSSESELVLMFLFRFVLLLYPGRYFWITCSGGSAWQRLAEVLRSCYIDWKKNPIKVKLFA